MILTCRPGTLVAAEESVVMAVVKAGAGGLETGAGDEKGTLGGFEARGEPGNGEGGSRGGDITTSGPHDVCIQFIAMCD